MIVMMPMATAKALNDVVSMIRCPKRGSAIGEL